MEKTKDVKVQTYRPMRRALYDDGKQFAISVFPFRVYSVDNTTRRTMYRARLFGKKRVYIGWSRQEALDHLYDGEFGFDLPARAIA